MKVIVQLIIFGIVLSAVGVLSQEGEEVLVPEQVQAEDSDPEQVVAADTTAIPTNIEEEQEAVTDPLTVEQTDAETTTVPESVSVVEEDVTPAPQDYPEETTLVPVEENVE